MVQTVKPPLVTLSECGLSPNCTASNAADVPVKEGPSARTSVTLVGDQDKTPDSRFFSSLLLLFSFYDAIP